MQVYGHESCKDEFSSEGAPTQSDQSVMEVMGMRAQLENILCSDPSNTGAHRIMEKLRAMTLRCPDTNERLKTAELACKAMVLISTPTFVEIETTTRCNINPPCVMCHTRMYRSADDNIEAGVLETIGRFTPFAKTVSLHGGGEPLLVPHLFNAVEAIAPEKTEIIFSTNGLLLTEKRCREILNHGVGYINVSLDAATPETYRNIRRNDLNRAVENVTTLTSMKRAMGLAKPKICLSMVAMRANIEEAVRFVELTHAVGADYVEFMKLGPLPEENFYRLANGAFVFDYKAQMLENVPELHDSWMKRAYGRASELGLGFRYEGWIKSEDNIYLTKKQDIVTPCDQRPPQSPPSTSILCKKPWNGGMILTNGDVIFCCHLPGQVLGNIKEQSFEEAWNGEKALRIRWTMLSQPLPSLCRDCHVYKKREKDPAFCADHETLLSC